MTQEKSDVVAEVIDGRRSVYGNPADTFPRVAQIWSGILGTEVQAFHVPLLLMGYKLARTSECPEYSDNSDDIEGYLDTFREVMGDELITARTVDEFLKKKAQRERKARGVEEMRAVHADPCWMWNQTWDRKKWAFVCICKMQPDEVAKLARDRAMGEEATPESTSKHSWSKNHGTSANPRDIHSAQCWKSNEHNGPDDPWICICREACKLDHPAEMRNVLP